MGTWFTSIFMNSFHMGKFTFTPTTTKRCKEFIESLFINGKHKINRTKSVWILIWEEDKDEGIQYERKRDKGRGSRKRRKEK